MKWHCLIACLLLASTARADGKGVIDPIGDRLFPPDLIMAHQAELKIDEKQRDAIVADVQKTRAQLVALQWQMKEATDELARQLEAPRLDGSKALAQADKMMAIERQFKRGHLGLLIRIRNLLSEAQRARLAELRKASP